MTTATHDMLAGPIAIRDSLIRAGVKTVITVPDNWMKDLQEVLEASPELRCIPVAREEEGIGIGCGAYLGGHDTALMMANSGFLATCSSISQMCLLYEIPALLLVSNRGALGEDQQYQIQTGLTTIPVIEAMGLPYFVLDHPEQASMIGKALRHAHFLKRPVVILMGRGILKGEREEENC
jgi:sulfopyruvate decarboxylase subunit alpha